MTLYDANQVSSKPCSQSRVIELVDFSSSHYFGGLGGASDEDLTVNNLLKWTKHKLAILVKTWARYANGHLMNS